MSRKTKQVSIPTIPADLPKQSAAVIEPMITERSYQCDAVATLLGVSTRTVWRLAATDPTFPQPRKLNKKITVWLQSELNAYIRSRPITPMAEIYRLRQERTSS